MTPQDQTSSAHSAMAQSPPLDPRGFADDEITLGELWQMLVGEWRLLALVTSLSSAVAVTVALILPPTFVAEVVLSPASSGDGSGQLSRIAGQFGDLAALAGINRPGGEKTAESVATLQSRALTEQFVREENLLPLLFAGHWNAAEGRWRSQDPEKIPTEWDANELFKKKIRRVSEDRKSGLITLTIEWKDKELAARWANELVHRANAGLRQKAIERSSKNIAYLTEQLKQTETVEVRQSLYRLLEAEQKSILLAQGSDEYAFRVIDPAVPPKKKAKPRRSMIVLVGTLGGFFVAALLAFLRKGARN